VVPPQKVLITGVTGFIGSALARWLLNRGIRVFGLVRRDSAHRQRIDDLPELDVIEIDGNDRSALRAALAKAPLQAVFNLAAYGVSQRDTDVAATLEGNVGFLVNLLESLPQERRPLVIHCGSCFEYGAAQDEVLLDETSTLSPGSLYGAAKASSVLVGHALAIRLNLRLVALRLFGVYGPGEAGERLIPSLIAHLWNQRALDLTPGRQVRDLLHVDDACAGFWAAATTTFAATRPTYNLCSGNPVAVREVAELLAGELGRSSDVLRWGARSYRPDEPMWLVGDNRRFRAATGWAPAVSLRDGLRATAMQAIGAAELNSQGALA
jgi:nucleoside-diphosphate-sugar epimerase